MIKKQKYAKNNIRKHEKIVFYVETIKETCNETRNEI